MGRKKFLVLFFSLLLITSAFGQEPGKHEWKSYVDQAGRFYINKNLPVYLRVATSPNENAQTHLLRSETSPQYSNPFYLDAEGYNTIRTPSQVDTVTKKVIQPVRDIIFEVFADGEAPVTRAKFLGAPKYVKDGKIYYGKNLQVELVTMDKVSGVETIFYSLDGAAYQPYKDILILEQEKVDQKLSYYAVDNCGNAETPQTKIFTVDRTGPLTLHRIIGNKAGGTIARDAKIAIESKDDLSGLWKIYYTVDGRKPQLYVRPLPASLFIGGKHKIGYFALDNVKNNDSDDENNRSNSDFGFDFDVDANGPDVSYAIEGDQHKGKHTYVSTRSTVQLSAKDDYSEIKKIGYGINNPAKTDYSAPFSFIEKSGIQKVNYYGIDGMNNKSRLKYFTVYMDKTAPVTGVKYGSPQFFNRDTLFISVNTDISFTLHDYESGTKTTQYTLNENAPVVYNGKFKIDKEGAYKLKFNSVDNVNNKETEKTSVLVVDDNSPVIYVNFSIQEIRKEAKDGTNYSVYPSYTKMYIGATDRNSGTQSIFYSINGGTLRKYTTTNSIADTDLLAKPGFYSVKIVAKDKLGNQSEKIVEFFIANN